MFILVGQSITVSGPRAAGKWKTLELMNQTNMVAKFTISNYLINYGEKLI